MATFPRIQQAGQSAVTAALCAVLSVGPVFAAIPPSTDPAAKPTPAPSASAKLTKDQQVLHALNRLTFGPRPGDVAAVEKIGLQAWFERQLNPSSIPDPAMDAIMARFPAMQLSQEELNRRLPGPATIKGMARRGSQPLPTDPTLHAIYADAIESYRARVAADAAGSPEADAAVKNTLRSKGPVAGGASMVGAPAPEMAPSAGSNENMGTDSNMAMAAPEGGKKGKRANRDRQEYSGTPVNTVLALAPDERVSAILAMPPQQEIAFRRELGPLGERRLMIGLSPSQMEVVTALQGPVRVVAAETLESRLLRDVYSDRQLEAVMTDFWLNHFNVYDRKNQNEIHLLPAYERDTIRPRALGHFEDLLVATAESPAMLVYLDNWLSIGPDSPAAARGQKIEEFVAKNPDRTAIAQVAKQLPKGINENYAREVIELHTVGVRCEVSADRSAANLPSYCGSGYTQADVTNLAKVLTGWTIDKPYAGGKAGNFAYEENRHEQGAKQVFGVTIQQGGQKEGLQVLHMLATSPATAHFISHKLAVRFVSDTPPQAIEDRMAKTFLSTNGDIKQVLRTMFNSPEFWAPAIYRAKVKTPIEFVASALRASNATVGNALPLVQVMTRLGMPLYGMPTPNGYSWSASDWVSTSALVSRMNFALVMSGDLLPGTRTDFPQLLGEKDIDPAALPSARTEQQLEMLLLGQPAAPNTRAAVMEESKKPGTILQAQKNLALNDASGSDDDQPSMKSMKQATAKSGKGKRADANGLSMTALAGSTANDGPLTTMAGLLLGSPEFQKR